MTIVVTGGGSGGHITPLLAVAAELKKQEKDIRIVYIGQRGDRFARIVADSEYIDSTKLIFAGKFRRYHGEGWKQLLDIKTVLLNVRDLFLIAFGCVQSWWYLRGLRPNAVFIKGGFVGVPVGLAAGLWRIPYITHDSDALAGLANRLIAKKAQLHTVALPKEIYTYPPEKTVTVGVPIADGYQLVDAAQQKVYKKDLGLPMDAQLLFVTGGGLGAKIINDAMVDIAPRLLESYPSLYIIHSAGHVHSSEIEQAYKKALASSVERVKVKDYLTDMHVYSGAADVVVARAGATNMAELAVQGKACIIVPNPVLAGGHQLKNAQAFADTQAVTVVRQEAIKTSGKVLYDSIAELLDSPEKRHGLGKQLHTFAYANAARKLAMIVLEQAKK
jgi:UDP-N-acetylglucosamine--N-acetylmuramyl-(pentapeptide) pyrophosphoryl-undecaprenol N-acetylglucosamine transferase